MRMLRGRESDCERDYYIENFGYCFWATGVQMHLPGFLSRRMCEFWWLYGNSNILIHLGYIRLPATVEVHAANSKTTASRDGWTH